MKLIAKTLYGLEKVLAEELKNTGATEIQIANRAVFFTGDKRLLYKVNYCARTALSVLMPVTDFLIRDKEDLYKRGVMVEWDLFMGVDDTFAIVPVVNSPHFGHTGYAGLILKDAIADYFRKKSGKRPSVDTCNPRFLINLHISNTNATISIDSSVVPLFKRGYRQSRSTAPLNEVLAAGILLMSDWKVLAPLTDPMCGSGTIPIEAGLIACNIPPGKFRKFFGFQQWKDYDDELFCKIRDECDRMISPSPVEIYASDISQAAVEQTKINVTNAGLNDVVKVDMADFKELSAIDNDGYLFLNPPYGQRLNPDETDDLYSMIGTTLKHNFPGNTAWLITSNRESLKHIGLKPMEKHTLFNGALECVFLKYEMYSGTRKPSKM